MGLRVGLLVGGAHFAAGSMITVTSLSAVTLIVVARSRQTTILLNVNILLKL